MNHGAAIFVNVLSLALCTWTLAAHWYDQPRRTGPSFVFGLILWLFITTFIGYLLWQR